MESPDPFTHDHWESLLAEIDLCIAQEAIMCRVRLLDPGVAERVLQNDISVCGSGNPVAFRKLQALLTMHFTARGQIAEVLGEAKADAIAKEVREHLRGRIGDQLGGPAAARA